ncbi:MAG TPA: (Fe-S)-binding protein [Anaerolineae bacterium]
MFVEYITLDHTRACIAEPGKLVIVGNPSRSIDAVLPLLNAMLPNVVSFSPRASALVLRRKPGFITLLADTIYITQVKDADEGLELLAAVRDLLNQTWEARETIQPRNEERRTPRPLDVWELLPRTNCRRCGEATCMAFGFALLEARRQVDECPPLADGNALEQRETLRGLLGNLPVTTSVWGRSQ